MGLNPSLLLEVRPSPGVHMRYTANHHSGVMMSNASDRRDGKRSVQNGSTHRSVVGRESVPLNSTLWRRLATSSLGLHNVSNLSIVEILNHGKSYWRWPSSARMGFKCRWCQSEYALRGYLWHVCHRIFDTLSGLPKTVLGLAQSYPQKTKSKRSAEPSTT